MVIDVSGQRIRSGDRVVYVGDGELNEGIVQTTWFGERRVEVTRIKVGGRPVFPSTVSIHALSRIAVIGAAQ